MIPIISLYLYVILILSSVVDILSYYMNQTTCQCDTAYYFVCSFFSNKTKLQRNTIQHINICQEYYFF